MRSVPPSFYEVLGVAQDASLDEIEAAWRRLVRENHPDKADPANVKTATTRTAAINEAYQALRDPVRRARYDGRRGRDDRLNNLRSEEAIDALIRLRRERQAERVRTAGIAAIGLAAFTYSLRALKLI